MVCGFKFCQENFVEISKYWIALGYKRYSPLPFIVEDFSLSRRTFIENMRIN